MSEPRALLDVASVEPFDVDGSGDEAPTRARKVVLLAGAGALAVLGLGGALLLGGGPDETSVVLATTSAAAPAPAGPAPASPTASPVASVPPTVTRPVRDPFVPVGGAAQQAQPQESAPTVADPTVGGVTGSAPDVGGVPEVGGVPGSGSGPVGGGTSGGAGGTAGGTVTPVDLIDPVDPVDQVDPVVTVGRRLALTRVGGTAEARTAVLTLDGKPVTVAVGATFGTDLLLLSLQEGPEARQWTAVVQRGDDQPFDVLSGAPVPVP